MSIKNIKEAVDLKGKKVLLRLDLNVPIKDGMVENDFRIKKIFPTIKFLKEKEVKILIISHIGEDKMDSLFPVYEYLRNFLELTFVEDILSNKAKEVVENMQDGDVVMFENLRQHSGEVTNDEDFSKKIASLVDIYVNEAFPVSHRPHSSVVGVPKFLPSYSGILFDEEIKNLSMVFDPKRPFLCILGGNKLDSKLPLINKIINIADNIFVGGGLAHNFFLEKGFNIGDSVRAKNGFDLKILINNPKIILPIDVMVENKNGIFVKKPEEVISGDKILDAGIETTTHLGEMIKNSKFILWNGPLGDYTIGFKDGTIDVAKIIAESGAKSVVGGGDTIATISELGLNDKFTFLSTGGGAMLEFLVSETLIGIEALKK